jgi:hypothetical protein
MRADAPGFDARVEDLYRVRPASGRSRGSVVGGWKILGRGGIRRWGRAWHCQVGGVEGVQAALPSEPGCAQHIRPLTARGQGEYN